ncbi:hypothetical protein AT261_10275 [Bacillus cereus]|uniref:nucleoside 2-deoxyribosyltransferase n=1 Tax=unclassified Bacillus (in: firmicutes) TaxID=185979 RepID=UPI00077AB002|nr:hypothetical protein AT261_10275 [Bacillus cereus]
MTTENERKGIIKQNIKQKTCFIVTPIGNAKDNIRRQAEGVIDAAIQPVLDEQNIKVEVAHRINETGSITRQVIDRLINADLVVANLTELNPNVMYELGVRHAARKPVIVICQNPTNLPFDVNDERTIFYTNDMQGVIELQENFRNMLPKALQEKEPDNPVYRAITYKNILKEVKPENREDTMHLFLLEKIESLDSKLNMLTQDENERIFLANKNNSKLRRKNKTEDYILELGIGKTPTEEMLESPILSRFALDIDIKHEFKNVPLKYDFQINSIDPIIMGGSKPNRNVIGLLIKITFAEELKNNSIIKSILSELINETIENDSEYKQQGFELVSLYPIL